MGLTDNSGSLKPTSAVNTNPALADFSNAPNVEQEIRSTEYTENVYNNKTVLTEGRDQRIIDTLGGFVAGTPITVTFLHHMKSSADDQAIISDLSLQAHQIASAYLRINEFELRLEAAMSFSYDADNNESTLTGTATVYPGFQPHAGDLFIYELEPGSLGLFRLTTNPERLSIKTGTSHRIEFALVRVLTTPILDALLSRVVDTAWFNKQRFLSEDAALLTSNEVLSLANSEQHIDNMQEYMLDKFYDKMSQTFWRPDGVYDSFIIDFIKQVMPLEDSHVYCEQLLPKHDGWRYTVWMKLLNRRSVKWTLVRNSEQINTFVNSAANYRVNALLNRDYVSLETAPIAITNPTDPNYIAPTDPEYVKVPYYISENIGNVDATTYNQFDTLLGLFLEHGTVDTVKLLDECNDVYGKDELVAFYRIPILIFFLQVIKTSILEGKRVELMTPVQYLYRDIPIDVVDADIRANSVLEVLSLDATPIAVKDELGSIHYIEEDDITTTPTGALVDISLILFGRANEVVTGTWKVIITNNALSLK